MLTSPGAKGVQWSLLGDRRLRRVVGGPRGGPVKRQSVTDGFAYGSVRQGSVGPLCLFRVRRVRQVTDALTRQGDLVLPCLNEAEALPWVLARVPEGWRAVVVDNGSVDGSPDIARACGATVVREERRGFGAACHAGLIVAEANLVAFCDCDASLDPRALTRFVPLVEGGMADLVLARRRPVARGVWPLHARAGNRVLAGMVRRRTGLSLHDLGPLRLAWRKSLLDLELTDRRSGYPLQMVVRAADAGWRIEERDVDYLPRSGKSKVTGTWRGTWHAVRDMRAVLR